MHIDIVASKDAEIIARLNHTAQRLHAQLYPNYFKPFDYTVVKKAIENSLSQENWFAYIACDATKPVGYVIFFIRTYEENPFRMAYKGIHIDQISIEEDYRHCGIGTLLMQKVEEIGKKEGAAQLELTYWDRNGAAKEFYTKQGFEEGMHFVIKKI